MSERAYHIDVCPECKVREEDGSEKKLYQCQYCERWFCERHIEPRLAVFRDLSKLIKDKEWRTIVEEDWRREGGHPDYAYTKERFDELKIEKEIIRARIGAFLDKSKAYRKPAVKERRETLITRERNVCPKCGSERVMNTAFREEFEAFECLSCNHKWKEEKDANSGEQIVPIVEAPKEEEKLSFVKEESPYESTFTPTKPKRGSAVGKAVLVFGIIVLILGVGLMLFPKSSHKEGNFQWGYTDRPVSAFDLGTIPKNVQINVDYDVEEPFLEALAGRMYVIIINASELLVIDQEWNSRLQPTVPFLTFRFDNVDFGYYAYDGPSSKGSLSWTTPYEGHYMVLVWASEMGGMAGFVYFIRIDATWHPYFTYGIALTILGIVTASVGFAYKRFSPR